MTRFKSAMPFGIAFVSASAFLLAGCGSPPQQPTAADQVFQAKSNYQALLVQAVKYRRRPPCRPIVSVPPRPVPPIAVQPRRSNLAADQPASAARAPSANVAAARPNLALRSNQALTPIPNAAPPSNTGPAVASADPSACSNPHVVDLLRSTDNAAEAVIDNAETTVRDRNTTPAQQAEAVQAAQNSVASFEHVLTQYGVQ